MERHRRSLSEYDQSRQIVDVVREIPEYQAVYSQTLRDVGARLDHAFQAFFRRVKNGERPGYPRFRSARRYGSLTYPQPGNGSVRIRDDRVSFSKLATNVRFVRHRPIEGRVRVVTISRQADRWFVHFACDQVPPSIQCGAGEVGIDMGLTTLAVLTDGSTVENPRFARNAHVKLARAQRAVPAARKAPIDDANACGSYKNTTRRSRINEGTPTTRRLDASWRRTGSSPSNAWLPER